MVVGAARARERKGRRVDGFMVMGLVGFRFVCVCVKEFGAVVVSGVVSHWEPPETVHHLSMRVAGQRWAPCSECEHESSVPHSFSKANCPLSQTRAGSEAIAASIVPWFRL